MSGPLLIESIHHKRHRGHVFGCDLPKGDHMCFCIYCGMSEEDFDDTLAACKGPAWYTLRDLGGVRYMTDGTIEEIPPA